MTLLPYILLLSLFSLLACRYIWFWYLDQCWQEMVILYVVRSGAHPTKVNDLLPVVPLYLMALSLGTWTFPPFIRNQDGFNALISFFENDAKVVES